MRRVSADDNTTAVNLTRQWWYLYAEVLRGGVARETMWQEFLRADAEVQAAGIVKPGRPMPRKGAEDLADKCDEIRKRTGA